jgi:metal-responsive CopG/Arc/MetJ family transcriptional regulator
MAHPSFTIPDELLDDFDDVIWELQRRGELDRDASRSSIVRELMHEWIEEQIDDHGEEVLPEGNWNTAATEQTAD